MTESEYKLACKERNKRFKEKFGREMTAEDVIKSFGGKFVGESQVDCNFRGNRISTDDGVKEQT